jgi:hypothetical protein
VGQIRFLRNSAATFSGRWTLPFFLAGVTLSYDLLLIIDVYS